MAVDAHLPPLPGGSTHFDRHKYTVAAGVGSAATAAIVKGGGEVVGGSHFTRAPVASGRPGLLAGGGCGRPGGGEDIPGKAPTASASWPRAYGNAQRGAVGWSLVQGFCVAGNDRADGNDHLPLYDIQSY